MTNKLAIIVTISWFTVFIVFGLSKNVLGLELNALGDYLAGVSAPVAFFWLYLAYRQQSKELKLQREQLALQQLELKQIADDGRTQSFYKKMEFEEGSLDLLTIEMAKQLIKIRYVNNENQTVAQLGKYQKRYEQGDRLAYWSFLQTALVVNNDPENIKKLYYCTDSIIGRMMPEQYIVRVNNLVKEASVLDVESVVINRHSVKLCRSLEVRAPKVGEVNQLANL